MIRLIILVGVLLTATTTRTWGQPAILPVVTSLKITALKDADSSDGTGFIINHDNSYYLVTAKHVYYPATTQEGYTSPTYSRSYSEVIILDPVTFKTIQHITLLDKSTKSILYHTYKVLPRGSLDIAVIRIDTPSAAIEKYALPFSVLSSSIKIYPRHLLRLEGYPARHTEFYSSKSSYAAGRYQRMLRINDDYYFIMETEKHLEGNSGGPVFSVANNSLDSVVGIFVGQNTIHHSLSYAIFANYIRKVIESY